MSTKSSNHYITVSRTGELWARRKGRAPVRVATAASGIEVETDDDARARGAPSIVRVRFAHGGGNRELRVMAVEVSGEALDPDAFLARFEVSEAALGRWLRASVERALDTAERSA
ncbi:Hypothetical protein A7982_06171 [Minicystis rosea]|nr:Hypothetical protein A7982_06171 [Minicystis rosea]